MALAAALHADGAAGEANPRAAKRYYRKACRLGHAASCAKGGIEDDDVDDDDDDDFGDDDDDDDDFDVDDF